MLRRRLTETEKRNRNGIGNSTSPRAKQRRVYERKRELHRLHQARWAKANPDCMAASMDKWEAKNAGYFRQHDRDRFAAYPERFKAKSRVYNAKNCDAINARRRAERCQGAV